MIISSPSTSTVLTHTISKPHFQGAHRQAAQTISHQNQVITQELDHYSKEKNNPYSQTIYAQTYNLKGFFQQLASAYSCFQWVKRKEKAQELTEPEQSSLQQAENDIPKADFDAEVEDTLVNQKALMGELRKPSQSPEQLSVQIPKLKDNYMKLSNFYTSILEKINYQKIQSRIRSLLSRNLAVPE